MITIYDLQNTIMIHDVDKPESALTMSFII